MNKEWQFGRCPVCDAITSLDPENNQSCDRCYSERSQQNCLQNKKIIYDTCSKCKLELAATELKEFYTGKK